MKYCLPSCHSAEDKMCCFLETNSFLLNVWVFFFILTSFVPSISGFMHLKVLQFTSCMFFNGCCSPLMNSSCACVCVNSWRLRLVVVIVLISYMPNETYAYVYKWKASPEESVVEVLFLQVDVIKNHGDTLWSDANSQQMWSSSSTGYCLTGSCRSVPRPVPQCTGFFISH